MNLTDSIAPRSDQANAEDFLAGPRTLTIEKVVAGTAEQPVEVHTLEMPGRPYKPSRTMRRVFVLAWGAESAVYAGRRMTLFRNPETTFGRDKVGGIEISHLSDIDSPLTVALTVTRGRRKPYTVKPLPPVAEKDWPAAIQAAEGNVQALRALRDEATRANAGDAVLSAISVAGKKAQEAGA